MSDEEMERLVIESPPKLKAALEADGRTNEWAAKRLSITAGHLSDVFRGVCRPSFGLAVKINDLAEKLKKVSLVAI